MARGVAVMNPGFLERGGGWVVAQWVLMIGVLAGGPLWTGQWSGAVSRWVAVPLFVAGAALGIGGVVSLGKFRTIFPHPAPESRLVSSGAYRIVRHPLYASLVFLGLGWALWWRSWPDLVLALGMIVFLDAKARHEESLLRAAFGGYGEYARRVKRLIPWVY
jgi:protein-S-isoprenylcysteine O-methyltransferase Ste14